MNTGPSPAPTGAPRRSGSNYARRLWTGSRPLSSQTGGSQSPLRRGIFPFPSSDLSHSQVATSPLLLLRVLPVVKMAADRLVEAEAFHWPRSPTAPPTFSLCAAPAPGSATHARRGRADLRAGLPCVAVAASAALSLLLWGCAAGVGGAREGRGPAGRVCACTRGAAVLAVPLARGGRPR